MIEVNAVPDSVKSTNWLRLHRKNDQFRLRSYQTEMVEESLKKNIIVTMDTGSGKTHIAIARTEIELRNCDPDQMVWFLAPTVPLCDQQARMFKKYLPAYQLRFLSSRDNVDAWSNQRVWDAILKDTRLVVSTPQVLLDALSHGFVKIDKIALLIFDEAHMCRGNHPASKIMRDFYHFDRSHNKQTSLPHILGLTATPVVNASCSDLGVIETSLNALAMAPTTNRTELIQYAHKPVFVRLCYKASMLEASEGPPILVALSRIYHEYDIEEDPYILSLRRRSLEENGHAQEKTFRELDKLLQNRKTYVHTQLKRLHLVALNIFNELGEAATEFYVRSTIKKFNEYTSTKSMMFELSDKEGEVLKSIFSELRNCPRGHSADTIPPKMEALIQFLVSEVRPDFTCIVFAEQRATVAAMQYLLASHPQTKKLFNIGTFVGLSSIKGNRKLNLSLSDVASIKEQEETLDDFRTGKKNVIIATSVLEEGIDVSKCNTVICYNPPPNMKSFIQRRGRARKQDSKYVIMLSHDSPLMKSPEEWNRLEEEMQVVYQNHYREIEQAEAQEDQDERGNLLYLVPSTGARLNFGNCIPCLFHFCSILGRNAGYNDSRPEFSFKQTDDLSLVRASVDLPAAVEAKLRHHLSKFAWKTERLARQDAAFQACKTLHQSGLLNDNLLPLTEYSDHDPFHDADETSITNTPSLLQIPQRVNPWVPIAAHFLQNPGLKEWFRIKVSLALKEETFEIVLSLPAPVLVPSELNLYWVTGEVHALRLEVLEPRSYAVDEVKTLQASTHALFSSAGYVDDEADELMILCEKWEDGNQTPSGGRSFTFNALPADHVYQVIRNKGNPPIGLVRDRNSLSLRNPPLYRLERFFHENDGTDGQSEVLNVELSRYHSPRGHVILNSNKQEGKLKKSKTKSLAASECTIDSIPFGFSVLRDCLPAVLHQTELLMVADQLCKTNLAEVRFKDPNLVLRAISAAGSTDKDYERLENLGDAILKFITCLNLVAEHPNWPEYYLTKRKDLIVSNSILAKASLNVGLNQFLVKDAFVLSKNWRLESASTILSKVGSQEKSTRGTSSKTLADLIESLLGAAYAEGGMPKALRCVKTLLPFHPWKSVDDRRSVIASHAKSQAKEHARPIHLEQLEELIGYKFENPYLLLEAITHGSCNSSYGVPTSSYQRLEFLGDSILDMIITRRIYAFGHDLSPRKMHEVKTTVVGEGMLNFLCFELVQARHLPCVKIDEQTGEATVEEQGEYKRTALWQWIRHSSPALLETFRAAETKHEAIRNEVIEALFHDADFPWRHLEPLAATTKVPSDVLEAIIAAIFIDSTYQTGSSLAGVKDSDANREVDDHSPFDGPAAGMSACEDFIKRIGLFEIVDRLLRDEVNCLNRYARLLVSVPSKYRSQIRAHPFFDKETGLWSCRILFMDRVLVEKDAVKASMRALAIRQAADIGRQVLQMGSEKGVAYEHMGREATPEDRAAPTIDCQERPPSPPIFDAQEETAGTPTTDHSASPSSSKGHPLRIRSRTSLSSSTEDKSKNRSTIMEVFESVRRAVMRRQSQESSTSSAYMNAHETMEKPASSIDHGVEESGGEKVKLGANDGLNNPDRVELAKDDDVADEMDISDAQAQERPEKNLNYEQGEEPVDGERNIKTMKGKQIEGEVRVGQEVESNVMEDEEMEKSEVGDEEELESEVVKNDDVESRAIEGEELEDEVMEDEEVESEAMEDEDVESEAMEDEEVDNEAMDITRAMQGKELVSNGIDEDEELESETMEVNEGSDIEAMEDQGMESGAMESEESGEFEDITSAFDAFTDEESFAPLATERMSQADRDAGKQSPGLQVELGELFARAANRGLPKSKKTPKSRGVVSAKVKKSTIQKPANKNEIIMSTLRNQSIENLSPERLESLKAKMQRLVEAKTLEEEASEDAKLEVFLETRVAMGQGKNAGAATQAKLVEEERELWNLERGAVFRVRGVNGHFVKRSDSIDTCLYVPPQMPTETPPQPSRGESQSFESQMESHDGRDAQDIKQASG